MTSNIKKEISKYDPSSLFRDEISQVTAIYDVNQ